MTDSYNPSQAPQFKSDTVFRFSRDVQVSDTTDALLASALQTLAHIVPADGAAVALVGEQRSALCFRCVRFSDAHPELRNIKGCYPVDKSLEDKMISTGKSGQVFRLDRGVSSIKPFQMISPVLVEKILAAPILLENKLIGLICSIFRENAPITGSDEKQMMLMAGFLAHPLGYERIRADLAASREQVRSLNSKKDRVISHLSHELKTPLAVLLASFELVQKAIVDSKNEHQEELFQRIRRNLDRLVEIEYQIEDILRDGQTCAKGRESLCKGETGTKAAHGKSCEKKKTDHFFREVNAAFLVHELKEPISVIESNALMMLAKTSPAKTESTPLDRVLRSVKKARNLLFSLLEVGRAESAVFCCRSFSPVECLKETLIDVLESTDPGLFSSIKGIPALAEQLDFLKAEGIRIEVQAAAGSVEMTSDVVKYSQIIANLIRNALFYRRRSMLVLISLQHKNLYVAIRDDGPGIAPEHKEAIFERYKQIHASPDIARNGHGLGLGVSRILARAMGGDITIESQLGQGAVFRLMLPLLFMPGT